MIGRRDETPPSMQSARQLGWPAIYRESGLARCQLPSLPGGRAQ